MSGLINIITQIWAIHITLGEVDVSLGGVALFAIAIRIGLNFFNDLAERRDDDEGVAHLQGYNSVAERDAYVDWLLKGD